jgi:hypothetical protein
VYGFPPSACEPEEAIGLMMNLGRSMAQKTLAMTAAAGASSDGKLIAKLYEDAGGDPAKVAAIRIEAAKAEIRREGGARRW